MAAQWLAWCPTLEQSRRRCRACCGGEGAKPYPSGTPRVQQKQRPHLRGLIQATHTCSSAAAPLGQPVGGGGAPPSPHTRFAVADLDTLGLNKSPSRLCAAMRPAPTPTPPLPAGAAPPRASLGLCRPSSAVSTGRCYRSCWDEPHRTLAASSSTQCALPPTSKPRSQQRVRLGRQRPQCKAASQPLWTPAATAARRSAGDNSSGSSGRGSGGDGSSERHAQQQPRQAAVGWLQRLPPAILPWDHSYLAWSSVATTAAAVTAFLVPWEVAFVPAEQLYSLG